MAEGSSSADQHEYNFTCSICLNLLTDPVTLNCGHNFCTECINTFWNTDAHTVIYRCPDCRQKYSPRPVLGRNNMLDELVKNLKKPSSNQLNTGPGDVKCDYCTVKKQKAIKACLICMVYLCEAHLKEHPKAPALRNHKLVKARTELQERICSQHFKPMGIYCQTDQICMCFLCVLDKQMEAEDKQREWQERIQEKQNTLQELKLAMNTLKRSTEGAVEDSAMILSKLISSLETRPSEVMEKIRNQEKAELIRAEEYLKKLEKEMSDLTRKDNELKELTNSEDPIHFFQGFQALCTSSESDDFPSFAINHQVSFDVVKQPLIQLKSRVEELINLELSKIIKEAAEVQLILPLKPWETMRPLNTGLQTPNPFGTTFGSSFTLGGSSSRGLLSSSSRPSLFSTPISRPRSYF